MILPIYVYGSKVLREVAKPIDLKMEGLQQFLQDMYDTMKKADGVGLAAPQVGKSWRIVVVDGSDMTDDFPELKDFKRFLINPVILEESSDTVEYSEGCLSVPDIHCDVTRPASIKVKYMNENLKEVTETFTGFGCRMVQHELDHLDGHMFIDHVTPIRKKLIAGKLHNIQIGKFSPRYKVKGNF
jgi:peptide deformylase